MEEYKINLNTPIEEVIDLHIESFSEGKNDSYILTLSDNTHLGLHVGQLITYQRKLYIGNGKYTLVRDNGQIISIDNNEIEITKPVDKRYSIKSKYIVRQIENSANIISEGDSVSANVLTEVRIRFTEKHKIFQQDVELSGYTLTLHSANGIMASGVTFNIPLRYEDRKIEFKDCVVKKDKYPNCSGNCEEIIVYDYIFLPKEVSRDSILFIMPKDEETGEDLSLNDIVGVSFNKNPYIHKVDDEIQPYNDLWEENIDDYFEGLFGENYECKEILTNFQHSTTTIIAYDDFYKIDLGISSDSNEIGLGNEDTFGSSFVEDIKESLIPDIVDMERIKYVPAINLETGIEEKYFIWETPEGFEKCSDYSRIYTKKVPTEKEDLISLEIFYYDVNGNFVSKDNEVSHYNFGYEYAPYFHNGKMPTLYKIKDGTDCKYYLKNEIYDMSHNDITGITFCLHFLKRAEIKNEERITHNSIYTSGNVYYDSWHIDNETRETTWWNGFDYSGTTFNAKEFKKFHEENGDKSDLIGYLNFTDNDIFYRKKKVGQSFLRLSFYTSPDPIEQKLLYYSTIFLDDGELYGKYIKQLQEVKQNGDWEENHKRAVGRINENAFVVLYSGGTRVDSQITVTNEFNRLKSSEGFNIYLFAEDKYLNIENTGKTIYMRVEFNHAGNGKTTPLIIWPSKNGQYVPLTTENFIESLYIPVELGYINGKYVYTFKGCDNVDNNIILKLYEPKLDMLEDETGTNPPIQPEEGGGSSGNEGENPEQGGGSSGNEGEKPEDGSGPEEGGSSENEGENPGGGDNPGEGGGSSGNEKPEVKYTFTLNYTSGNGLTELTEWGLYKDENCEEVLCSGDTIDLNGRIVLESDVSTLYFKHTMNNSEIYLENYDIITDPGDVIALNNSKNNINLVVSNGEGFPRTIQWRELVVSDTTEHYNNNKTSSLCYILDRGGENLTSCMSTMWPSTETNPGLSQDFDKVKEGYKICIRYKYEDKSNREDVWVKVKINDVETNFTCLENNVPLTIIEYNDEFKKKYKTLELNTRKKVSIVLEISFTGEFAWDNWDI